MGKRYYYTTAPRSYDYGCTDEVRSDVLDRYGTAWRLVVIHDDRGGVFHEGQLPRYASGMHPAHEVSASGEPSAEVTYLGLPLSIEKTMPEPDPYAPTITAHTLPLDRLCQVRHLTRELDRLLGQLVSAVHPAQGAADLIQGARASNAAARTLLRHAAGPLEAAHPERCVVRHGVEECATCGSALSLCACSEPGAL